MTGRGWPEGLSLVEDFADLAGGEAVGGGELGVVAAGEGLADVVVAQETVEGGGVGDVDSAAQFVQDDAEKALGKVFWLGGSVGCTATEHELPRLVVLSLLGA